MTSSGRWEPGQPANLKEREVNPFSGSRSAGVRAPNSTNRTRADVLATLTEREWQEQLVSWARRAGWRVYHTADSRRSAAGFPDLVLVHPGRGLVLFIEVKTSRGRVRPEQRIWLDELGMCSSVQTYLWRPEDNEQAREVLAA